jgi:hypothetical protein
MSPERVAVLVRRWVRFYTRDLPTPLAERRVAELDADLHDHIAHERAAGIPEPRIARSVASRLVRGLAADVAWRRRIRLTTKEDTEMSRELRRSVVRVALGVAIVTSLPVIAMQFSDEVVWSLADFVLLAAFLTIIGVGIELAIRRAGGLGTAVGLAALGIAAALFGGADDAPGLVLIGLVLIGTACTLGVRSLQHNRG